MHICMCFFMLAPAPGAYFGLLVAQMLGQHAICCQRRVRTGNTYNTDLVLLGPVFLQKGVFLLKCNIPCKKKTCQIVTVRKMQFFFEKSRKLPCLSLQKVGTRTCFPLISFVLCLVFWNLSRKHWWNPSNERWVCGRAHYGKRP